MQKIVKQNLNILNLSNKNRSYQITLLIFQFFSSPSLSDIYSNRGTPQIVDLSAKSNEKPNEK